ncbi:ABC transporter permease subunit [Salarchaeum sp. JOR-1]|uniref:ABC transporter permease subunit n=1 Tax=Salarchaeum sp. JOR-1 TaxID=2599399 RepID=UPI00119890CD|nr:ABC transporter permease subunit [Salarchaeum sp. JOR-1]QDX39559.1 ABC transporter permease [Salarchaeum sp. JOR-1]
MTPRRALRIARWEAAKSTGNVDRRTAVLLAVVVLALAVLAPVLVAAQPSPGEGIYRVGVDEDSRYHAVVERNPQLRAVGADPRDVVAGDAELSIRGGRFYVGDSAKAQAALAELRAAVVAYNDYLMRHEPDQAAAFPVTVTLQYLEQNPPGDTAGDNTTDGDTAGDNTTDGDTAGDSTTDGAGGNGGGAGDTTTASGGGATTAAPGGGGTRDGGGGTRDGGGGTRDGGGGTRDGGGGGVPAVPGGAFGGTQTGTPSSLSPPFPLRSLVLAFAFLLPLNVLIQAYGSSVINERINRRGEPMLVSPASRGDIVLGKTLPYLGVAAAITAVIAFAVGGGLVSVLAVLPLAALFLAATFVGAMLARSYKELTFVTVFVSVPLMAYAFVPAVFTEVHPIAAISPLSLVVQDLQGAPIGLGEFLFGTLPVSLAALVCFALGTGIYREEDMFTQRPIPAKAMDALAAPLRSVWRVGLWTALFIPFAFIAELFAVASLFVLPASLALPVLFAAIAVVEEAAKSLHVRAGLLRSRFPTDRRTALALGVASGLGFFLGEKLTLITQLVGLPDLELGQAAFGPTLGASPLVLAVSLFAPLALHTVTASLSALGARGTRAKYLAGFGLAVLVHLAYNLTVVSAVA